VPWSIAYFVLIITYLYYRPMVYILRFNKKKSMFWGVSNCQLWCFLFYLVGQYEIVTYIHTGWWDRWMNGLQNVWVITMVIRKKLLEVLIYRNNCYNLFLILFRCMANIFFINRLFTILRLLRQDIRRWGVLCFRGVWLHLNYSPVNLKWWLCTYATVVLIT
jgi:hypothetical protein